MLLNSGLSLAGSGNIERAAVYFRRALQIDPTFEPAMKALSAIRSQPPPEPAK